MAIWVIKDGQREGPYQDQDVRELLYEGTYADSDPAIQDGQFEWTTLGLLLGRQQPPASPPSTPQPPSPPALPEEPPAYPATSPAEPPPIPTPPPIRAAPPSLPSLRPIQVTVTDFDMPFGSMVTLMVKWVLASIPALLILGAIAAIFWTLFFAIIAIALRH